MERRGMKRLRDAFFWGEGWMLGKGRCGLWSYSAPVVRTGGRIP